VHVLLALCLHVLQELLRVFVKSCRRL